MSSTVDLTLAAGPECGNLALAVNPFVANHYHFGMLLGVDDLETDQGYHRGKIWLHNAWLHGAGVVWGLGVSVRAERREVVVAPGLALTPAGREVYLDREYCVDIARWLTDAAPDSLEVTEDGDDRLFTVHIVIGPRQCLDRPVPSIAEPCAPTPGLGGQGETAYSREAETALLDILPNEPEPAPPDYPLLRAFLGLGEAPDDEHAAAIRAAYAEIESTAAAQRGRARAEWLRRFAADDVTARTPYAEGAVFPAPDDATVLLARVRVHLTTTGDQQVLALDGPDPTTVDQRVRTPLVATSTIQELAAAGLDTSDPHGAHLIPGSAELNGAELRFAVDAPLAPPTVTTDVFTATRLDGTGWQTVPITSVALADGDQQVVVTLGAAPPADTVIRLVAETSGPTPLLGADGSTVAGGHDIAIMVRS